MARGNQREIQRERGAKRAAGATGKAADHKGNEGLSLEQRKVRDADILRQKQLKKDAAKEAEKLEAAQKKK